MAKVLFSICNVKYDYAIIQTNYTSRIPEKVNSMNENCDECKSMEDFFKQYKDYNLECELVCIKDNLWVKYENVENYIYNQEDSKFLFSNFKKMDGYIAFKNVKFWDCQRIIEALEHLDYCVACNNSNIINITVYEVNDKKILHIQLDTESG